MSYLTGGKHGIGPVEAQKLAEFELFVQDTQSVTVLQARINELRQKHPEHDHSSLLTGLMLVAANKRIGEIVPAAHGKSSDDYKQQFLSQKEAEIVRLQKVIESMTDRKSKSGLSLSEEADLAHHRNKLHSHEDAVLAINDPVAVTKARDAAMAVQDAVRATTRTIVLNSGEVGGVDPSTGKPYVV